MLQGQWSFDRVTLTASVVGNDGTELSVEAWQARLSQNMCIAR